MMQIVGTWLVEVTDGCTCGSPGNHERGCGMEPIVDLATLEGWDQDALMLRYRRICQAMANAQNVMQQILDGKHAAEEKVTAVAALVEGKNDYDFVGVSLLREALGVIEE